MHKNSFKFTTIIIWLFLSSTLVNAATRILPLGDSITYDTRFDDTRSVSKRTGYRSHLWYQLSDANFGADFVGSKIAGQAIVPAFDPQNEGHPGWDQFEIAEETYKYMNNSQPDIVLLHIGTNDRTTTNPAGINDILNYIDLYEAENDTNVRVYVALIIDRLEKDGRIRIFNRRLAQLLRQRIANGDDIIIVDMYNNANLNSSDYADITHPNDRGYQKMANVWFNALITNFNPELSAFPYSLVNPVHIEYSSTNKEGTTINIITAVPDYGITF